MVSLPALFHEKGTMFISELCGTLFSDKSKCLDPSRFHWLETPKKRPIFAQFRVVHFLLPTNFGPGCCKLLRSVAKKNYVRHGEPPETGPSLSWGAQLCPALVCSCKFIAMFCGDFNIFQYRIFHTSMWWINPPL